MKTACVQKPKAGETIMIDFDLFPPAETLTFAPNPGRTQTKTEIITQTPDPLYPPLSPAAISASAAASSKALHDKNLRVAVGVGGGGGFLLTITAAICCILMRRRSARKKKISEEEMRARWEREHQARLEQKPGPSHHPRFELWDTRRSPVEADDGRPTELPMLENRPIRGSPGIFSGSDGAEGGNGLGISGEDNTSWNSSDPRAARALRSGISRFLGIEPAVPAKD